MLAPRTSSSSLSNGSSGAGSPTSSEPSEAHPTALWDARLGFFGVRPGEVGDLTPAQLLGCVDLFNALHGVQLTMARKITVEILGDSRSLEKAFAKSLEVGEAGSTRT